MTVSQAPHAMPYFDNRPAFEVTGMISASEELAGSMRKGIASFLGRHDYDLAWTKLRLPEYDLLHNHLFRKIGYTDLFVIEFEGTSRAVFRVLEGGYDVDLRSMNQYDIKVKARRFWGVGWPKDNMTALDGSTTKIMILPPEYAEGFVQLD